MRLYLPIHESRRPVEWKKIALRVYLCWSVCVDTTALVGILWYIFK